MNRQKLTYLFNFRCLQRNFFLLAAVISLSAYWYLHFSNLQGDNALVQITLSSLSLIISSLVMLFALLTCLWPYFRLRLSMSLHADDEENAAVIDVRFHELQSSPGLINTEISVRGIRKPLFGFARARIVFDDYSQSETILLNHSARESGVQQLRGRKQLWMPFIRDYRLQSAMIFFEDFFHLFALPFRETRDSGMFIAPAKQEESEIELNNENAEDPMLKVLQHKLAKGELFDYKKYTPGDDVRRIIWKNYARSGELTVRIPDRNYPYVSHINLLPCFYDQSGSDVNLTIKLHLLNIYKEKLRQVIDALIEQEFGVKLILDQELPERYPFQDSYQHMLYQLSAAEWQTATSPAQFLMDNAHRITTGSNLLAFSSLVQPSAIDQIGSGRLQRLNVFHYNMQETLSQIPRPSVLKRIFFVEFREPFDEARSKLEARETVRFISRNAEALQAKVESNQTQIVEL